MDAIIAKAVEKGIAKHTGDLAVGVYEVDTVVTLRVVGTIKKGADEPYIPTADIPLKAALALVLEKSGISRELSSRLLVEAMTEALKLGEKGSEAVEAKCKDIDAAMERVNKLVGKLPEKIRSGKTICKVTVTEVAPVAVVS